MLKQKIHATKGRAGRKTSLLFSNKIYEIRGTSLYYSIICVLFCSALYSYLPVFRCSENLQVFDGLLIWPHLEKICEKNDLIFLN